MNSKEQDDKRREIQRRYRQRKQLKQLEADIKAKAALKRIGVKIG